MTPLAIEILFHYHTRAVDYRDGDFSAPAVESTIKYFLENDLLKFPVKDSTVKYETTERAKVYLEAICSLPLPVYRMPE